MQRSLSLVWLTALSASVISSVYIRMTQSLQNRNFRRRSLTGCELARQVLDRAHSNRTAVTSVRGPARGHLGSALGQLALPEKIYYGNRLSDAALVFHEAAHLQSAQSLVPISLRAPGGGVFLTLVTLAWILILTGFLAPWGRGLQQVGQILFLVGFAMAFASLPEERKATRRALSDLTLAKDFGPEEKLRIKNILNAFRWFPLAELIEAPWNVLSKPKPIS